MEVILIDLIAGRFIVIAIAYIITLTLTFQLKLVSES